MRLVSLVRTELCKMFRQRGTYAGFVLLAVFIGLLVWGVWAEGPPMGDVTPAQARQVAGQRLTLEGNIQINRMYEATPAEIRDETRALMADVFAHGTNLIVSPTASPYIRGAGEVCFPQYQAMVDEVLAWRG